MELQGSFQIAKTISKKNSVGGLTLSDCKIYYQATVTDTKDSRVSFWLPDSYSL